MVVCFVFMWEKSFVFSSQLLLNISLSSSIYSNFWQRVFAFAQLVLVFRIHSNISTGFSMCVVTPDDDLCYLRNDPASVFLIQPLPGCYAWEKNVIVCNAFRIVSNPGPSALKAASLTTRLRRRSSLE